MNPRNATNAFAYSYLPDADLLAQLDRDTGGQALQTVLGYELQRNLVTNVLNQAGTTVISQYAYVNDAAGRRTSVKNSGAAFDPVGQAFNVYGYNSRSELTSANRYFGADLTVASRNSIVFPAEMRRYSLIVFCRTFVVKGCRNAALGA